MPKIRNAVDIRKRRTGIDPQSDPEMRQIAEDFRIGQMIFDARTSAGLIQEQLAELAGTTAAAIADLEDVAFDGHSLTMLQRIASALHNRLEIRLVPDEKQPA
jgi:ribosome-binding protein aMBF1 (putative translation factor)